MFTKSDNKVIELCIFPIILKFLKSKVKLQIDLLTQITKQINATFLCRMQLFVCLI